MPVFGSRVGFAWHKMAGIISIRMGTSPKCHGDISVLSVITC